MNRLRTTCNLNKHKLDLITIHQCPARTGLASFPTTLHLTFRQSRHVSFGVREICEEPCSAYGHRIPRGVAHRGSHPSIPTHLYQSVCPRVYLHVNEMTNQSRVYCFAVVDGGGHTGSSTLLSPAHSSLPHGARRPTPSLSPKYPWIITRYVFDT